MCDAFERKEYDLKKFFKKIIYMDMIMLPFKNGQSTPMKFKNQDLHDLFIETLF